MRKVSVLDRALSKDMYDRTMGELTAVLDFDGTQYRRGLLTEEQMLDRLGQFSRLYVIRISDVHASQERVRLFNRNL